MANTTGDHILSYPDESVKGWFSTWELMAQQITDFLDNLDSTQINTITDGNGNERLVFGTTASAVNHIQIDNAATGNGPLITAAGGDSNVPVRIKGLGTGKVALGDAELAWPDSDGTTGQVLKTDGAGTLSFDTISTGETNTCSNVGTGGVGVFKQKTGVDFEFKKINAGSSKITITDDTGNSEVDIDLGTVSIDDLSDVTISSAVKGDIIVHNGTAWVDLAVGTNDYVLTADSAQTAGVKWAAASTTGAMKLLSSQTASGSSSIAFTSGISDTYNHYIFVVTGMTPNGANTEFYLQVSTNGGSSYESTSYKSVAIETDAGTVSVTGEAATNAIELNATNMYATAGRGWCGVIHMFLPTAGSNYTRFVFEGSHADTADGGTHLVWGGGAYESTTDVNAVQFIMSSNTIAEGTFTMFGVAEA